MTSIRSGFAAPLAATLVWLVSAGGVFAADPTFATGQRIGMTLLPGLAAATGFAGFESMDRRVKVAVLELPPEAFAAIEAQVKSGKALPNAKEGKPEPFDMVNGKALFSRESGKEDGKDVRVFSLIAPSATLTAFVTVQVEDGAPAAFSEDAIRTMLASTTVRAVAPVEEQLAMFPLAVKELAQFKTVRTIIPGSAILLTDGTGDESDGSPYVVITLIPGGPSQPDERARAAQQLASTIPGLAEARTTSAEAMRIGGTPGYETRIEGKGPGTSGTVNVVQWLRFQGGATIRIIAGVKKEQWDEAFPRFRAVRDGLEPK
jgi:hypothetical protein